MKQSLWFNVSSAFHLSVFIFQIAMMMMAFSLLARTLGKFV